MDLDNYRDKYNKSFNFNSELRKCLCGSDKYKKLFSYDRYLLRNKIVVCKKCGLIFANPILKKNYLEDFYKSDFYRKLYNLELDNTKKDIFLKEGDNSNNSFNFLKKFIIEGRKINILEVGSGHNTNLIHFKKIGNLYAVDYSNESKKLAKKMGITFHQGGVEVIKKFNLNFDCIILSHVIEHFHDFKNDIREIIKFSNQNTLFYIEVPSMDLKYNLDQLQNAHNFYFTKNTLIFHLNKLGLDCIEHGIASNIHQYGIFKKGSTKQDNSLSNEYNKIIKIHKKFCYEFYWLYLVNFYFRKFIKLIIGEKLTILIKKILKKQRNK